MGRMTKSGRPDRRYKNHSQFEGRRNFSLGYSKISGLERTKSGQVSLRASKIERGKTSGGSYYPRWPRGIGEFSSPAVKFENVFGTAKVKVSGMFDATKLCETIAKWQRRILHRAGAYVRDSMRNSMKRGVRRPDKRYKEDAIAGTLYAAEKLGWSEEEAVGFYSKYREVLKKQTVKVHSEKGKAPAYWRGTIKNSIFYFVDRHRAEVKIGPQVIGRGAALEVLEFGGNVPLPQGGTAYVAPRPFIAPAQAAGEKILEKLLREAKPIF